LEETIQYLQIATNIIIILLFIGLVILVFTLIKTLKKASSKIDEVSVQIKDIKGKLDPVIEKVQGLTENVNMVVSKVKDHIEPVINKVGDLTDNVNNVITKVNENIVVLTTVVEKVKESTDSIVSKVQDTTESIVSKFQDSTDSIFAFERKVRNKIEPPVMNTANTISAVSVGIKTFFETYKNRRKNVKPSCGRDIEELIDMKESIGDVNKELEEVNERLIDLQK